MGEADLHDLVVLGAGLLSEREGPSMPTGVGDCQCIHMGSLVDQMATSLHDVMSGEWLV